MLAIWQAVVCTLIMLMSAADTVVIREHVQPSDVSTADDKHVHDAGGGDDEAEGSSILSDLPWNDTSVPTKVHALT